MAIDGTYNITIVTPMGDRPASLTLVTDGNALSGKFGSQQGEQEWDGGTVDGNDVAWSSREPWDRCNFSLQAPWTVTRCPGPCNSARWALERSLGHAPRPVSTNS